MPNGIYTTVVGNLVADPELHYTPNGTAVANLTIANTPRFVRDGEWMDGETTFVRSNVWNTYAEHVAASLRKGQHVIAYGRIAQRTWEDTEGEKHYVWEMTIDEIGHTLRFGETEFTKDASRSVPPPEEKDPVVRKSKSAPKSRKAAAKTARPVDDEDAWENQEPPTDDEPPF